MPIISNALKTVFLSFLTSFAALAIFSGQALAQPFVVQVLSVNNQPSASAEVDRLMSQGVPSFYRAEDVPGAGLRHRVYLGPFDSEQEAGGAAQALKDSGLISEFIIRRDGGAPAPETAPVIAASGGAVVAAQSVNTGEAEGWPALPGQGQTYPQAQETWPMPEQTVSQPVSTSQPGDYWPPPPSNAPVSSAPQPGEGDYWPPPPGQGAVQTTAGSPTNEAGAAAAAGVPASTPVLGQTGAPVAAPGEPPLAPSAMGALTPPPSEQPTGVIPARASAAMKIQGFEILSDLSSSMRRLSPCVGALVKQEAVNTLLRKMNHRIPSHPYVAALRVFGYKQAWSRKDYSTLYFGPTTYDRPALETAIGRLFAADSISPFGYALTSSEAELAVMQSPRAVLMFADFEETADPGAPADKAKNLVRRYGDTKVYTFYVTRQASGHRLARDIAQAGNGQSWNICDLLGSEASFESMMNEIFGPADIPPCQDSDNDGVCDDRDVCPSTPAGAAVDERGCWIAAYSQFFDFDKAEVKSAFLPRIQYAAEILVKNPQLGVVTIAGHTDAKGTDAYNMELGRKRAQAVKDLLVKYGAPADKLVVESFGKTKPIAENDTEEGRAKNRRVEFHVGDVPK
ncbi:MAG: OmpA family protein [Deltaproteobacteria bacterium]|jgi:OOP family OmpA-OmpF porin|nr:OmpA family protein [Deltaproteobacteria bacterium]